ncbi:DUF2892 domain-containing protein [Anaeromyxobacter sp. Fw109-5]|uniref:YgaP family membrane protein n=1 Tax=Anaeromyxobacter sp. (strain Fw109-5) TaxID=404589 RepID=UPI0000ED7050|nr:DUF2892 domain-containing protein [Anaeromyxobacter sp. Fw109-5]ABS27745.1 conserved hypothetical protein [Anaeromyxobacter sp. Fw109-5]
MTVDNGVRVVAGTVVLTSLALGVAASPLFVSSRFLWLTAFVGVNLLQSAFTGFCPAEMILRKAGLPDGKGAGAEAPAVRAAPRA